MKPLIALLLLMLVVVPVLAGVRALRGLPPPERKPDDR